MRIIDLQRRITEVGRIRTGQQVDAGNGKTRPEKLDTFRFTSADKRRIEQIAALYGGKVEAWQAPAGAQWQVVTERAEIDVVVPPSDLAFSQGFELWSAGGCQRRCDGVTEQITDGPCLCNPEDRECDVHTRLSVLLRDIPGLGVWRLDTQGWYAAQELQGAVEVIAIAAGHGALLPARLRLDQRMVKRPDKNGKVVTRRFGVPVIDIEVTPGQLLPGGKGVPLQVASGESSRPAPLTPVPQLMAPVPSIAEQSQPPEARPRRANGAAEIPRSGRQRATGREAARSPARTAPDAAADDADTESTADPDAGPGRSGAGTSLVDTLRLAAAASDVAGGPSIDQKRRLVEAFRGLASDVVQAGVRAVFDHDDGRLRTGAEAQALITVADSLGDPEFRAQWAGLAG